MRALSLLTRDRNELISANTPNFRLGISSFSDSLEHGEFPQGRSIAIQNQMTLSQFEKYPPIEISPTLISAQDARRMFYKHAGND